MRRPKLTTATNDGYRTLKKPVRKIKDREEYRNNLHPTTQEAVRKIEEGWRFYTTVFRGYRSWVLEKEKEDLPGSYDRSYLSAGIAKNLIKLGHKCEEVK